MPPHTSCLKIKSEFISPKPNKKIAAGSQSQLPAKSGDFRENLRDQELLASGSDMKSRLFLEAYLKLSGEWK